MPAMPEETGLIRYLILTREPPRHGVRDERRVWTVDQILWDEPDALLRRHPLQPIEARQIDRPRVAAQRALAAQVEVEFEVAQRELTQTSIDGFAISAAGVVRLRDCAPTAGDAEQRDDMIGVALGLQIEDERRVADDPQRGGGEDRALQAMRRVLAQHAARRPRRAGQMVGHLVEKFLDTRRSPQRGQRAPFALREIVRFSQP